MSVLFPLSLQTESTGAGLCCQYVCTWSQLCVMHLFSMD